MIKPWLITGKNEQVAGDLDLIVEGRNFNFYAGSADAALFQEGKTKVYILIDGYVSPRLDYASEYQRVAPALMIFRLFQSFGSEWIHAVKGNYNILLVSTERALIFSDRIGIKKFFYHLKDGRFLCSNQLQRLTRIIGAVEINPVAVALYALMNHYIDGLTCLKNVFYSPPAARATVSEDVRIDTYWDCRELLNLERREIPFGDFATTFSNIVNGYVNFLRPRHQTLTLTGGLDSRVILAALLNNGIKPRAFAYGHPLSADVTTARQVAVCTGLEFQNHEVDPTARWFGELADEIVIAGNSLVHPHRAHRLAALREESRINGEDQMVWGGYMGGEGIRNLFFDGLGISQFTFRWLNRRGDEGELLGESLARVFIRPRRQEIDEMMSILRRQRYFGPDDESNRFFLSYLVLGGLFHSQDPCLFHHYVRYPVPVFLDIDFLYLLFRSQFNFLYRAPGPAIAPLKRLKGHELYCQVINILAPEIAHVPFAKRGYYSVKEYTALPLWRLALRRFFRHVINRRRAPVNFPLGKWLTEYVGQVLEEMAMAGQMHEIFNLPDLGRRFHQDRHQPNERYWRPFTNAVFAYLSFKHYSGRGMPR